MHTLDDHPNIGVIDAGRPQSRHGGRLLMPEEAHASAEHPVPGGAPRPDISPASLPRGPLTAELERPAWTRPPVPSASLRSLRTIDDLQSLLDSPSPALQNGHGSGSIYLATADGASPSADASTSVAGPDVLTRPGRGAGIGAPAKPQSSSNVVPAPSSRFLSRSPQMTATAAVGDDAAPGGLQAVQSAAEEPESNTGVPVFCMMPLDTVRAMTIKSAEWPSRSSNIPTCACRAACLSLREPASMLLAAAPAAVERPQAANLDDVFAIEVGDI